MRKIVFLTWILLPIPVLAYHFGPGQERVKLDQVAQHLEKADKHSANKEWADAVDNYSAALTMLPEEQIGKSRKIRLERAKAKMFVKKLPEAHQELTALVTEMQIDKKANEKDLDSAREALANSQYYMTWLMRLEGASKEQWKPQIEAARQTYRLLAQNAEKKGDTKAAKKCREDLESMIRLARMDLNDLQGLPLPSQ